MRKSFKKILPFLALIPWIMGTAGYRIAGMGVSDSLYAGLGLYLTSPMSDDYNLWIELARWTAPLVTATAVLSLLRHIWNNILWRMNSLARDSVAIYTDENRKICFGPKVKAAYPGEICKGYFRSHILLFSTDEKNLRFWEQNKDILQKKTVYIGLRELEPGLIREIEGVTLFNINQAIARTLWKEIGLWNRSGPQKGKSNTIHIAIWGNGPLSRQILATGLQLNLFSNDQSIDYVLITDDRSFEIRHPNLELMNQDRLSFCRCDSEEAWNRIRSADLIILADSFDCGLFQNILVNANGDIYYYSPKLWDMGEILASTVSIRPFGRDADILTDENIRSGKLIQKARVVHQQYTLQKGANPDSAIPWEKLSGFLKESNISQADYAEVFTKLTGRKKEMELAELEHIRWCRFYFLNYWKYAPQRDDEKKLHNSLLPFSELSDTEKGKNLAVVKKAGDAGIYDHTRQA